jgi:hypothetical protein
MVGGHTSPVITIDIQQRLCGDGAVSNDEAKNVNGVILHGKKAPLLHTHRTGLFRPTTALLTPPVGVPASHWMCAKARSKLGALIRLCGDGAMSNEAKMVSSFYTEKNTPPAHRTGLF